MSQKETPRDLFPGALGMMRLGTFERRPLYGYLLVQHLKRMSNDLLQLEEGSLYPAPQRPLKEEPVKAEWGASSTNRLAGAKHLQREVSSFEHRLQGISLVRAPGEL
jgi:PadR family transcriptional regulator